MNKTTTRLATIGGIVILGAFAIVLAQNDARKRDHEQPTIEPFAAQEAVPIPADGTDDAWNPGIQALAGKLVVRANNDKLSRDGADIDLPQYSDDNPLREATVEDYDASHVVLAGAGVPVEPPAAGRPTTGSPPSWLGGGGSGPAAGTATQPTTLPTMPSFPMTATGTGATAPGEQPHLPSLAGALPTLPPTLTSEVGDMSDTQRPAMPPTNMISPPGPSSSPFPPSGAVTAPLRSVAQQPTTLLPGNEMVGANQPPTSNASNIPATLPAALPPAASNTNGGSMGSAWPSPTNSSPAAANFPAPGQLQSSNLQTPVSPPVAMPQRAPRAEPTRTAALAGLVSNQPGNRYLDGSQNPNMLIQKRAPEEIQVGKKATFVIAVRNAGNATAHDVRVVDSVPQGSRFIESAPAATPDAQGLLSWSLGEMAAGDERTITLQIVPEVQGEVGSNALVYFAAQASVRTVATLPKLEMQVQSLSEMLIGSRQSISVVVKNSGTGVARDVRLEVDLPELLKHDIGEAQLTAPLGDMRPNEVRPITLDLAGVGPGQSTIAFRAVNDDGALSEQSVPIQVLAPQLATSITGPGLRYLERQATFVIKVSNTGTTAATNLDFIAHLPPGMKFVSTTQKGFYDPALHAVKWGLYELPVQVADPIELTLLPVELGSQSISFTATADLGLKAEAKHTVAVDGLAELAFTIGQDKRTIETGTTSTYWVQITNVGNKPDKDVQLAVQLPSGAVLRDVNAQVKYRAEGNQLLFDAVPEMRNKDQYTYRFQVQHNQPGTQIVRTQLTSSNWPVAVIKEEGTLVYNDQK